MLFVLESILLLEMSTTILFEAMAREDATYSWPQLKTWTNIFKHTHCKDYPCDLLIVIANANCRGNWCHINWRGNLIGEGDNEVWGMNMRSPIGGPKNMHAFNTQYTIIVIIIHDPLYKPCLRAKFLRKMTGHPILKSKLANGNPKISRLFKYSRG